MNNISGCVRRVGLSLVASLAIAGCSSSTMSRIDANRAAYDSWPPEMQQAVLSGQVKAGMTPEMVTAAVGKPTKVVSRSGKAGEDEIWVYGASGGGLKNTGVSMGGSIGGVGMSGGRGGSAAPTPSESE